MANKRREIRIFISSSCSGPFKPMRKELHRRINESGSFEAYSFDEDGASSQQLEDRYLAELRDCDVCAFIIDQAQG